MHDTFIHDVKVSIGPIAIYPPEPWSWAFIATAAGPILVTLVVFVCRKRDRAT